MPGLDHILPEMLKYGDEAVAQALHAIILEVWETEQAPADFKRDPLIPVPKKTGVADCKNLRILTLQPVAAKVYAMLVRECLSDCSVIVWL